MLSVETIKRQVDREGKRWGVFGVIKGDSVYAAAMGKAAEVHGGVGTVDDSPILLSRIDEDHTFPMFLAWRVQRAEFDTMRRFTEAAARRKASEQGVYDDLAGQFKQEAQRRLSGRIVVPVRR